MDFHSLKRRDLQALCKKNNIPANMTNASMADALASLNIVEGVEEYLRRSEVLGSESPERSVITSPSAPRTSTRQKASKEVLECSNLTTRTRCGTRRRAVEGTDAKKTTTTRTTRRRAPQESSTQQKMEEDLQAKFEADLEQSDFSENNGLHNESTGVSEVSGVSVDQRGIQNEPEDEVPDVNEEVHVGNDPKDSREEDHVAIDAPQGSTETFSSTSTQKVDFHSLSRKELQNLCKKNKIPANISNAAMVDALESLERVEGLEELLNESDCLTAKSPEMSRMTSTRVRQTRTCQKSTRRKPAYAGSALGKIETVQKKEDSVLQSLAKKIESNMEDTECPTSVTTGKHGQGENDLQSQLELCLENSEVSDLVSENSSSNNAESKSISLPEEVSDESETSRVVMETEEEDRDDVIGNKFGGGMSNDTETEVCDFSKEPVATADNFVGRNTDDEVKPKEDQFPADILGQKESNLLESEDTIDSDSLEIKVDGQEVNIEISEEGDTTVVVESESNVDEGLLQEAPVENDKSVEVFEVTGAEDSNVAEHFSDSFKRVADCATEDEDLKFDSVSVTEFSNDAQESESSSLDIVNVDKELENCQQELENPAHDYPVEKVEGIHAEDQMADTVDSESTTQTDQLAPIVEGTPLCHKSLRTLKKMLKKRLQDTTLANKMEKLSLDESEILLGSENSDAELTKEVGEDLKHEFQEINKESDGLANKGVSWIDDARVPPVNSRNSAIDNDNGKITSMLKDEGLSSDQINGSSENLAINSIVDAEAQYAVNILEDNEISEASVVGHVNVESVNFDDVAPKESKEKADEAQFRIIESDDITYPKVTPTKSSRKTHKPLLFTPSKCSSKTPKSAGRTTFVSDINKENIDNSASKTGPGKVIESEHWISAGKTHIAVVGSGKLFSAMSMGKLKKEFKVLQQQSERKRPALQSRSENQCPLASP